MVTYTKALTTRSLVHVCAPAGKLLTLTNFSLHSKPKYLLQSAARFEPLANCMVTYTKALTTRSLVHVCAPAGKLLTLTNFSLHSKPKYLLQSAARLEPLSNCIVSYTKALTTRSLVHVCAPGGKLLTLTNFSLHFKSKYLLQSAARFEPLSNCIVTYTKALTTRSLVHVCAPGGKLLTLTNFSLHF